MFSFLPGIPGADDLRSLARKVDTARHHGVPNGCVLELDLLSAPPETSGFDPMAIIGGGGRPLVLREAVAAIHRAAEDPRVSGLIARVQIPAAAAGPVQELRDAIAAFSDVKPSVAWAETYPGTLSYYLASAFREVWMQPSGTVGLVGFATNALFLRDALDKAGIEAQFIARGEYKSAANLFTQDRYTDAHREADSRLLDSLHSQVWQAVAESRHIEPAAVDELANKAPLLRDDAVTGRLVDRIGFRDEAYARIGELVGAPGISPETGDADSDPTRRRGCTCRATPRRPRPDRGRRCRRSPAASPSRRSPSSPCTARSSAAAAARKCCRSATPAQAGTPSPPRCARRPPTIRCRRSCCGSTAAAARSPDRKPFGEK